MFGKWKYKAEIEERHLFSHLGVIVVELKPFGRVKRSIYKNYTNQNEGPCSAPLISSSQKKKKRSPNGLGLVRKIELDSMATVWKWKYSCSHVEN